MKTMFKILHKTLLALIFTLPSIPAATAAIRDDKVYEPLPAHLDGSMMIYDFTACDPIITLPDSLEAIHVEYVARHGARFLSSRDKISDIETLLLEARKKNYLTADGMEFLRLLQIVEATNAGKWGDLSKIGIEEEAKLAARMHQMLPQLSMRGSKVEAISSPMPRCVMTMYEFTHGLVSKFDSIKVATDEGNQFLPLLCCFSANEKYAQWRENGDWREIYNDFVRRHVPILPALKIVSNPHLSNSQLRNITLQMYEVLKACRAAGLPAPTTQWMSEDEYEACWKASNLQHYLRNSISPLSDIAQSATMPLLKAIVNSADAAIMNPIGAPAFKGYFGHAETLLPLLAAMKLPGCYAMPENLDNLSKEWKVEEITPLAANLVILLAKAPSGTIYASLQLNGQNISPLPAEGEIVKWNELRQYWLK